MTGLAFSIVRLSMVVTLAASHPAKTDSREEVARAFFAAAKYQEAIDVYSQLFAQYVHPDYIYNIGRCYQNMGDPDKALQSFHEFERKAKRMDPEMRKELDAHIKEMEALKAERDALNSKLAQTTHDEPAQPAPDSRPSGKPPRTDGKASTPAASGPGAAQDRAGKQETAQAVVEQFLAGMRANPEKHWRERALSVDEAKLAKTVALVKNAKAADPRLTDYQLHLASQYAGKHFTLRLQELQAQHAGGQDSHKVTTGERKLGPEISSTFSAAAGYYLAVTGKKGFPKTDEALLGLAVLLEANNMESRARGVLMQLLRNYPGSKSAEAVKAGGTQ
jgi:tetratricopeptide (TPR) repeat protein